MRETFKLSPLQLDRTLELANQHLSGQTDLDKFMAVNEMEAKCISADPETFMPSKGGSAIEARRICREHCELTAYCGALALVTEQGLSKAARAGIFGALSVNERFKLDKHLVVQETAS